MSTYKTIFSGRLEFGSSRSYEQVLKMYQHRNENYYRNDILLSEEEVFEDSTHALVVPRFISPQSTEKSWKNTINLLKYINEFAIAGNLRAWIISEGKLVEQFLIEPHSDKIAVQAYLKGRELVKCEGMEGEAKKALTKAIEKFERHALAYERRGYVNFMLKNYDDALYDFSKSIDINPNNSEPYFGRAKVQVKKENLQAAISDFELAIKKSIPHQSIYWDARRLKGELHLELKEPKAAIFELRLFTKRFFKPDDPNFKRRKYAFSNYGKALFQEKQFAESVNAFSTTIELEEGKDEPDFKAEQFLNRGLARQKVGESGFVNDFKEAAELGCKKAAELLDELV